MQGSGEFAALSPEPIGRTASVATQNVKAKKNRNLLQLSASRHIGADLGMKAILGVRNFPQSGVLTSV